MPAEFDSDKRIAGQRMSAQDSGNVSSDLSYLHTLSDDDMESLFSGDNGAEDERIWTLLSLYVDGEASPEEAAEVEQMLQHDAAYASAHAFMQQAGGAIRTISEIEPPAYLRDAILAKTTRRPTFAQRVMSSLAEMRSRFALPNLHPVGRLALAGGGLASVALVAGILSVRTGVHSPRIGAAPSIASSSRGTHTVAQTPVNAIATGHMGTPGSAISPLQLPAHGLVLPTISDLRKSDLSKREVARVTSRSLEMASHTLPAALPTDVKTGSRSVPKSVASPQLTKLPRGKKLTGQQLNPPVQGPTPIDQDVQNINPMMDANLQHRTTLTTLSGDKSDGDDIGDERLVASSGNQDMPADGASASTERETPRRPTVLEGKLLLAKLPPTARHIMSPAEVARQVNNTVPVSFTTNSTDDSQHRPAEVRVLSTKF